MYTPITTITQMKEAVEKLESLVSDDAVLFPEDKTLWKAIQFARYQSRYEGFSGLVDQEVEERYQHLKKVLGTHPCIASMIALNQPDTLVRGGDFVTLRMHNRWHLLTVRKGKIRTVHFMQADGAWRTWMSYAQALQVERYATVGEQFATEVQEKLLATAKEYLVWSQRGLHLLVGNTSEDIQVFGTKKHSGSFVLALQKIMDTEAIGLALLFPDAENSISV